MTVTVIKGHGSYNDIFIVPHAIFDLFESMEDAKRAARALCNRKGAFGADGVYFADISSSPIEATFLNADGSVAEFCGNGMRLLARVAADRQAASKVTFTIGHRDYVATMRPGSGKTVRQVAMEMPLVDLTAPGDVGSGLVARPQLIPALESALEFTPAKVPNPHLIAVVDDFDEQELARVGGLANSLPDVFPHGANVSFALPLINDELFVQTYERGSGLTLSCGTAAVAATCVAMREGLVPAPGPMTVRNPGGPMRCELKKIADDVWLPEIEGNATVVYSTSVDLDALLRLQPHERFFFEANANFEEIMAFGELFDRHSEILDRQGIAVNVS